MEKIRELEDIGSLTKRTPVDMTDAEWQQYFNNLKETIKPSRFKRLKTEFPLWVNGYKGFNYFTYSGDTQYQYYCKFINGVLATIRKGQHDYCFHIYQIADLLRFEHDRLKTVWLPEDQCFDVSLF